MMETRVHPETGKLLHRDVRRQVVYAGSLSQVVDVPGWYPNDGSDALHTGADLEASNEKFTELKSAYAAHVKAIRKSLRLTQEEAGQIIGGGLRAFQKYESGAHLPSYAAIGLIEILARHPEEIEALRQLRSAVENKPVTELAPAEDGGSATTQKNRAGSRTITALFETRPDAEAAKNRLEAAVLRVSHVDITDKTSTGYTDKVGTGTTPPEPQGFWTSLKGAFSPGEDRHVYEEGVRRGGTLLTATVYEYDADKAVDILDNANSVDIDGRADDWKKSGWVAPIATTGMAVKPMMADHTMGKNEEMIPIIEETLRLGKREVERGGVRVRSYIVETPVSEQVTLRDEHVSVERRPVTGGTVPADAFRDRTIEMTETGEEAVIAKDARIVEEVVVHKNVENRTEAVSDTVRRTEIEVDNVAGIDKSRMAGADSTTAARGVGLGDKVTGLAKDGGSQVAATMTSPVAGRSSRIRQDVS